MQIYQYTNPMNTILPSPDLPTMKTIATVNNTPICVPNKFFQPLLETVPTFIKHADTPFKSLFLEFMQQERLQTP